ncbi:hypothetical protein [Dokdonella sp.]|uniref:hypothetical protein n=1 Tax=Dokdonella sp. TaxID=2291710 RepID=UPI002F3F3955
MTERRSLTAGLRFAAIVLLATSATAQERYAGRWTIERGDAAPWARGDGDVDPAEVKRLVGTRVTFEPKHIRGPAPLACDGPKYVIEDVPAEGLFQGGLAEYGDHRVDADAQATRMGFAKRPIATLDTGCEGAIDFHATGDDELLFALDNVIYRLHRDAAHAASPRKTP